MKKIFLFSFLICLFLSLAIASYAEQREGVIPNAYSATISWNTDKPSTSCVEYDVSKKYGYSNITGLDEDLVTSHKVTLRNLKPATLYHYRIRSKDAFGNEAVSPDFTFVTLKEPPKDQPPQILDVEAAAIVAAGPQAPAEKETQTQEKPVGSGETTQEAGQLVKHEAPIEKTLIQKGGILLPKGKRQFESGFTYAHISKNRIAVTGFSILPVLVIGEIDTETIKRDIFIQTSTFRYGLRDDLQIETKIPFRFQHNRTTTVGATAETIKSKGGLGDIEGSIFHHWLRERGGRPDLIAGLTIKSNTGTEPYGRSIGLGTGHWAIRGSLVGVKSSDPAILFGNFGYTYSIPKKYSGFGKVEPGSTFQYGLGLAFALNYQVALNFQVEQLITTKMKTGGQTVNNSFLNVINFKSGLAWSISKNLSLDFNVGLGLTEDAPDAVIELRLPYTF